MLPCDKRDTGRAEALVALGWEKAQCVMPRILESVQDGHWPVAAVLRPFLMAQGARLAPYVRPVLGSDDECWKYFIVANIVRPSLQLASAMRTELARLATSPTMGERQEGVAALAKEIVGLITKSGAA